MSKCLLVLQPYQLDVRCCRIDIPGKHAILAAMRWPDVLGSHAEDPLRRLGRLFRDQISLLKFIAVSGPDRAARIVEFVLIQHAVGDHIRALYS